MELTDDGQNIVQAIIRARRRLLSDVLTGWSQAEIAALADLNRWFADALIAFDRRPP